MESTEFFHMIAINVAGIHWQLWQYPKLIQHLTKSFLFQVNLFWMEFIFCSNHPIKTYWKLYEAKRIGFYIDHYFSGLLVYSVMGESPATFWLTHGLVKEREKMLFTIYFKNLNWLDFAYNYFYFRVKYEDWLFSSK